MIAIYRKKQIDPPESLTTEERALPEELFSASWVPNQCGESLTRRSKSFSSYTIHSPFIYHSFTMHLSFIYHSFTMICNDSTNTKRALRDSKRSYCNVNSQVLYLGFLFVSFLWKQNSGSGQFFRGRSEEWVGGVGVGGDVGGVEGLGVGLEAPPLWTSPPVEKLTPCATLGIRGGEVGGVGVDGVEGLEVGGVCGVGAEVPGRAPSPWASPPVEQLTPWATLGIRGGEGAGRGKGTAVVPRSPPPPPRSALIVAWCWLLMLDMLRAEVVCPGRPSLQLW